MPIEERVRFPSGDTQIELEGRLHRPDGPGPHPAIVVCHPYPPEGGSLLVKVVRAIARAAADRGLVALRFNFRGVGASRGAYDDGRGEVDDVAGAVAWLAGTATVDASRLAVVGYSFGASMALAHQRRTGHALPMVLIGVPLTWKPTIPPTHAAPWLFVAGDDDGYCPLDALRTIVWERRATAQMQVVAGTDHFFIGREEELATLVVDFLVGALAPRSSA